MLQRLRLPTPFRRDLLVGVRDGVLIESAFVSPKPSARDVRASDPLLREIRKQVAAYCAKRLRRFDVPLHLAGTPFQCRVWELVSQLEVGELVSYADVARAIGHPLSHRGVAAALGRTPYDLFVPAHRVIGSDGRIKGADTHSMRRRLLAFEGIALH